MNGARRAAPTVEAHPSPPANGKPVASKLDINRESRRPLFAHTASKQNSTKSATRHADCKKSPADAPRRRPASSSSARPASAMSTRSDRSTSTTPRGTGVSKSNTDPKHSKKADVFTLADAWGIAEEMEDEKGRLRSPGAIDASPSPAPRSYRRSNSDDSPSTRGKQQRSAKGAPSRTPRSRNSAPSGIPRPPGSSAPQSSPSTSGGSGGRRVSDFGRKPPASNLFGKGRIAPKLAKTGEVLARKASNGSLDGRATSPAPNQGTKARTGPAKPAGKENDLPGVRPSPVEADVPVPSVEPNQEARLSSSWDLLDNVSPNKSYAWQVDDEFTAGDLQVSDSPRIRFDADTNKPTRPRNTKLDDIMEREAQDFKNYPLPEGARPRPFNPRLGEIEELENQIDDYAKFDADRPRNSKIDEIRALEMEVLSNKALATSRLAEIRAMNSQARPRSASPVPYRPSSEFARDPTRYYDAESSSENGEDWVEGERIPNTPVTVFRKTRNERPRDSMILRASSDTEDYGASDRRRDVSRRFARTASTSPEELATNRSSDGRQAHNHDTNPKQAAAPANPLSKSPNSPSPRQKPQKGSPEKANKNSKANPKPSVGFVGLRRVSSSESTRTKRSSMAHSDGDPTERIEREMMLFAPADNQSDKGSIRVPSPDTSEDECEEEGKVDDLEKTKGGEDKAEDGPAAGDLEETPRPRRQQNILSMPTPQVTGAYVETPATVKVEPASVGPEKAPAVSTAVSDKPNVVRRRRSHSASDRSDKGESDRENPRAKARAERSHRRTRSLPKHRQPLLNTAKPATVRDDLMELHQAHNIEDSTLDDFGELLASKDVPDFPEIDEMLEDITDKFLDEVAREQKEAGSGKDPKLDSETELITRMTKTLETGLFGIRSAKQGIERLEDQVSHADPELLRRAKEKVEKKMRGEIKQEETGEIEEETVEHVAPVKREVKEKKPAKLVDAKPERPVTKSAKASARETEPAYVSIPLPRLYRRSPLRLTFLGLLLIAAALYCAAESAVCSRYCRPTTCTTGPCIWSLDDPTFGYAIPRKVDDWTTGGQARTLTARLAEELSDLSADALDYVRGTDIRDVSLEDLAFEDRRKHRRRLGRKGFGAERVEPAEHRPKWDAWRTERAARERASAAREMGYYDYGESESMSDDARV